MKFYRMASLVLAAAMLITLISGCKVVREEVDIMPLMDANTTTEAIAATEEAATTAGSEIVEPSVRTVDLDDEANATIKRWVEEIGPDERPSEYPMRNGKTITVKRTGIFLRDEKTKKETVLLESKISEIEETNEYPQVEQLLDDRYFAYTVGSWEDQAGAGVYDTVRMKAIPIEAPQGKRYMDSYNFQAVCGDTLYLRGPVHNTVELGPLQIFAVDLRGLDKAETLKAGEDLLKNVPEAKFEDLQGECYNSTISPNGRYCAVQAEQANRDPAGNGIVAVFDLHQKAFVMRMEKPANMSTYQDIAFFGNNTLYVYGKVFTYHLQQWEFAHEILEIKFY